MEKRVIRMLACLIVFTLATVSVRAQLIDGGFETNGIPNWSTFNFAFQLANTNMASGVPHGGTHVLQAYGPFNGNWDGSGASQIIAASPGQSWTLNGFAMDPSGDSMKGTSFGLIQVVFKDSLNNTLATFSSINATAGSPTDVWMPLTASGVAPAGTADASITVLHLSGPNNYGGSIYFDDLSVVVVPEPSSVVLALTGLLGLVAFAKKRRV